MKHVTVYCSEAASLAPDYYEMATAFGTALAAAGLGLIYGGTTRGLMGAVADGVLDHGGRVVGVVPNVPKLLPFRHNRLTEMVEVEEMRERKRIMYERTDAFVVLPGGYGTLDEVFEVLTLRKLDLHEKTVYFMNHKGFWQPMADMLEHFIAEKTMNPHHRTFYKLADNVPDLMGLLAMDSHLA